ncbi:zinc-dependent alcohol dehydrogenase family protein [Apilactobacillus ozensis]|uniref:Sorbitol dehydrogenase n=1 Tax=Apilactobacillus ozensis DSM 23829 = JCM 17196 TaxID=1423781 RepID=A0A0R2ARY5_9LACO|nr:zinc-dependent alcohol dehydrogenase family protein [Apilactobacillus ozensis]KRM69074.1 sorbitol dehydrogenase [Apilactobacillus ozensis DSM 23829 = JCM 17196]MCK8607705.1 zinc-dependent alcohol dehydrogenase family protein [Apilactobacillus ozensis]
MKALVLTGKKQLEIQNLDQPEPKANEVLVNAKYAGICGTDYALYNGLPGSAPAVPPIVLGHENSGVVAAVGSDVKDLKVGDKVTVDPNIYCGKCDYCRTSRPELCESLSAVGVTRNGGLEEYFTAPETVVYKLPENVDLKSAATCEPISCAVHGMELLDIKPYQKALVIGDGFMGLIFAQMLKSYGVKSVDLTGRHDDKLAEEKEKLGVDRVINTTKEKIPAEYDVVIEAVGQPATQEQAVEATVKGAQVLMFGVGAPDQKFSMNTYEVFQKQLTIKGAFINPNSFEGAIALLQSGKVDVNKIIDNVISLEDVESVLNGTSNLKGKSVVKISD